MVLLALAPFIAFAVVDRLGGPMRTDGRAIVSAELLVRDRLSAHRSQRFLRSARRSYSAGLRSRWRGRTGAVAVS
jgi:hypothetical protein